MPIPEAPQSHGRSPVDRAATVVMCIVAALAASGSVMSSLFFVMATDSCGTDNCDVSKIGWAYAVSWGGVGMAVVIVVVGLIAAARRGTAMWVWPTLALIVVVSTLAGGAALAAGVVR